MICPECRMENPAEATQCIRCGHPLTQAKQPVNQVWNTDIDRAQNQKNSRTALIALGVSAVLLIGLFGALFLSLPSMGDALIGKREPGQSFSDRMDNFGDLLDDIFSARRGPVPEAYAAIPDGADEEFIELFEEYIEKDYSNDYTDSRRLSERYYEEFAAFKTEHFTNGDLAVCAAKTAQALDKLHRGSILSEDIDENTSYTILWLEGCVELYAVVEELYERYGILYYDTYIPEYYIWLLPIYEAQLEAEYDLFGQLIGIDAEVSDACDVPYLTYTNNTIYEMDITFYNDYETEDDYFYEECSFESVMPGDTILIPLRKMPEHYEAWYTDWIVDNYYIDGMDIYDYYW